MEKLIRVYYNEIYVSTTEDDEPYEVYSGCPYLELPMSKAESIADDKIDSGEWHAYIIPDLVTNRKIVFYL
jgi:hypothetical protein